MTPCRICGEDHDDLSECPHGKVTGFPVKKLGAHSFTVGSADIVPDYWPFVGVEDYIQRHRQAYPENPNAS